MLRKGEKFVRQSRPALEVAAGFFRMKDAGEALYRAAFLTVRDQLVCFDDLERAGDNLKIKDVLGLASMLREQRGCKIVLLMNKSKVDPEQEQQFSQQLEKVVDTFLVFEPTTIEAVTISVEETDLIANALRERISALSITNIRVIKKIERLARQLEIVLDGRSAFIIDQMVSTVSLAGWCFFQPSEAPDLDYIKEFNSMLGLVNSDNISIEEQEWRSTLENYGYSSTDELDALIIEGVSVGYFRQDEIREAAISSEEQYKRENRKNTFSDAWKLYHNDITVDDNVVLDAMQDGAMANLNYISPDSMNATVLFMRRYERDREVSNIISSWIEANRTKSDFFSHSNRFFFAEPIDPELVAALDAGQNEIEDERDPADTLKAMAERSGFNPEADVALFSKLSVDEWVDMFDANSGKGLAKMMEWARIVAAQPGGEGLRANLDAALNRIAARSPMRADRLRAWGVLPK